jgi:Domain of unknown function(DUF2779)
MSPTTNISANQTRVYLTKSLFQRSIECSRKLWYHALLQQQRQQPTETTHSSSFIEPPQPTSSFYQHLANDGKRVGRYAQTLYDPHGIRIHTKDKDLAVQLTKQLLSQERPRNNISHNLKNTAAIPNATGTTTTTLYEAAVVWKNCFLRADILQKIEPSIPTPNAQSTTVFKIVEVKAKSWDSSIYASGGDSKQQILTKTGNIRSEFLSIIHDITFQQYVFSQAYADWIDPLSNQNAIQIQCSLLLPDTAKTNTNITGLYNMFPLDSKTGEICPVREQDRMQLLNEYNTTTSNETLLTEVDVTDLVQQTLRQPLIYPGCNHPTDTTKQLPTFQEVLHEWNDFMDHCNNTNQGNHTHDDRILSQYMSSPSLSLAPIGSHCRDCEFRNPKSEQQGAQSRTGFAYCWNKVWENNAAQNSTTEPTTLCNEIRVETSPPLVLDLYFGGKTIDTFMEQKKYHLGDIAPQDLGLDANGVDVNKKKSNRGISRKERQWHQVKSSASSPIVLDKKYLVEEFNEFQYPYHFIDFETIAPVLPFTIHKHPYQSIAFQFSHHILHDDGSVEHTTEFLHTVPEICPNLSFLNAIITCFEQDYPTGTIFRWGSHENTILRSIWANEKKYNYDRLQSSTMERFFGDEIGIIDRGMVDLMNIVSKGYYVHGSNASVSIKSLLLPTLQYSPLLRTLYEQPTYTSRNFTNMQWWYEEQERAGVPMDPYKLLKGDSHNSTTADGSPDGGIAHGGDAIAAYSTLQQKDVDLTKRNEIERSLLRYCELDTLAMVMIMQALMGFLRND